MFYWVKNCTAVAAEDDPVFAKREWQEWRKGEIGSKGVGGGAVMRLQLSEWKAEVSH